VVVSAVPFHFTTAPDKNGFSEPALTVSVRAGPPATAELGLTKRSDGVTGVTVKVRALDGGALGLTTVMEPEPGREVSSAGMRTESCPALTSGVLSGVPFHWAVQPFAKPEPLTWMERFGPPAAALAGKSDVRVALPAGAEVMAKERVVLTG